MENMKIAIAQEEVRYSMFDKKYFEIKEGEIFLVVGEYIDNEDDTEMIVIKPVDCMGLAVVEEDFLVTTYEEYKKFLIEQEREERLKELEEFLAVQKAEAERRID